MKTLSDFRAKYKWICYSMLTEEQKAMMLGSLLTELKQTFMIPLLRNEEWETKNQALSALYSQISTTKNSLEKLA